MDFFLLILVTAVLYIRPTDFIPILGDVPVYEILIVACCLASMDKLTVRIMHTGLKSFPVAILMICLMVTSIITNLAWGRVEEAFDFTLEFSKILFYFLLLIAIVNTPRRLKCFLGCLVFIDLVPTVLATLHYHGELTIPAYDALTDLDATRIALDYDDAATVRRLRGSGAFADPNDFSEILNQSLVLCSCGVLTSRQLLNKVLWSVPVPIFVYALSLTHSRGGMIGLLASVIVLLWAKYGLRRSVMAGALTLPLILTLFAGRMTTISTSETTSQSRIQLWHDGFAMLRGSPVLGIGTGQFVVNAGHVAHNAYIQAYTELGCLGGTIFFGTFYCTISELKRLCSESRVIADPVIREVQPYLLATLVGYATSEISLTHCYSLSTYVLLGLVSLSISLASPNSIVSSSQLDGRGVIRLLMSSGAFLLALYVFTQMSVRYG